MLYIFYVFYIFGIFLEFLSTFSYMWTHVFFFSMYAWHRWEQRRAQTQSRLAKDAAVDGDGGASVGSVSKRLR